MSKLTKKIFNFVLLSICFHWSSLAFCLQLPVTINYFGEDKLVAINLNESDKDLFQDFTTPEGVQIEDKPLLKVSPKQFLTLLNHCREALSRGNLAMAEGGFNLEILRQLPEGYLPSMLRMIHVSASQLPGADEDLDEEDDTIFSVTADMTGFPALLSDPYNLHELSTLAFGANYREALDKKVFTLFSLGTGSNFYNHSRTHEEILEAKQNLVWAFEGLSGTAISLGKKLRSTLKSNPNSLSRTFANEVLKDFEKLYSLPLLKTEEGGAAAAPEDRILISLEEDTRIQKIIDSNPEVLRYNPNSYGMFKGEITSTFARHAQGLDLINFLKLDGPGSYNYFFQNNFMCWEKSKQYNFFSGTIKGSGRDENIENASFLINARMGRLEELGLTFNEKGLRIETLKSKILDKVNPFLETKHNINPLLQVQLLLINELSKGSPIEVLNTIGWSRGAIVTLNLSHKLTAVGIQPKKLKMNILAVDPVPGLTPGPENSKTLSALVNSFKAFYAQHELSPGFVPVLPLPSANTSVYEVDYFPGHHGIVAGSNSYSREPKRETVVPDLGHIPNLIRYQSLLFLESYGSEFRENRNHNIFPKPNLSEQLEMFGAIQQLKTATDVFQKVANEKYEAPSQNEGDHPIVAKTKGFIKKLVKKENVTKFEQAATVASVATAFIASGPVALAAAGTGATFFIKGVAAKQGRENAIVHLSPDLFAKRITMTGISSLVDELSMFNSPEFIPFSKIDEDFFARDICGLKTQEDGFKAPKDWGTFGEGSFVNKSHVRAVLCQRYTPDQRQKDSFTRKLKLTQKRIREKLQKKKILINDLKEKCLRAGQKLIQQSVFMVENRLADSVTVSIDGSYTTSGKYSLAATEGNNWERAEGATYTVTINDVSYQVQKTDYYSGILIKSSGPQFIGCRVVPAAE